MPSTTTLPYGDATLALPELAAARLRILEPTPRAGVPDERAALLAALRHPLGAQPLAELARGKSAAVITVSDVTRMTKSDLLVPLILDELAAAGLARQNVTVLFAVGGHRQLTREEQARLVGEAAAHVTLVNHDSRDATCLRLAGQTSRGTPVWINRLYLDAPLRIVTGAANYHDFAGFSGGPKGILPGVAGQASINANHVLMFSPESGGGFHPKATNGETTANPPHSDMLEAARLASPDYLVNVALNARGELVVAAGGELHAAHQVACRAIVDMYRVATAEQADLVITSPGGYPKDLNLYQSIKALTNVQNLVRPGGVIILAAECREGLGAPTLGEWLRRGDPATIERLVRADFDIIGKLAFQLHTWLARHHIIVVSSLVDADLAAAGVVFTRSLEEALRLARRHVPAAPDVAIAPAGNITFCDVASA